MRKSVLLGILFATLAPAAAAGAEPARLVRSGDRSNLFMRVYGPTLPPYGFVRFCESNPRECASPAAMEDTRFNATGARFSELDEINRHVNKTIEPVSDLELYGETERWTIPTTKGDCEDYALLKRKLLIARGWPVSSLLMTVVRDEKGEGHAILTARTAQGDFVLDNKSDEIKVWHRTAYAFVMRQSFLDPRVWVSLDPKDAPTPAPLAGVKPRR